MELGPKEEAALRAEAERLRRMAVIGKYGVSGNGYEKVEVIQVLHFQSAPLSFVWWLFLSCTTMSNGSRLCYKMRQIFAGFVSANFFQKPENTYFGIEMCDLSEIKKELSR